MADSNEELSCCSAAASGGAGNPAAEGDAGDVALNAADMFTDFMKATNAEGLIDAKAKRLMAIALSVGQRCGPCLKIHMRNALDMGITKAEIDEAAWLAISFTGCTGMMFYQNVCTEMAL